MEFLSEQLPRACVGKPVHRRLGAEILRNLFRKRTPRVFLSDLVIDEGWFSVALGDRAPQLLGELFGRFKTLHLRISGNRLAGVLTKSAIDLAGRGMSPIKQDLQLYEQRRGRLTLCLPFRLVDALQA